jgi:2-amino-4-hydroxy-6-hydroxymethyldihydropteridine diphosphokinase
MGPRVIDVDILFYENRIINTEVPGFDNLVVPHERIQERAFVLKPLNDVASGITHLI